MWQEPGVNNWIEYTERSYLCNDFADRVTAAHQTCCCCGILRATGLTTGSEGNWCSAALRMLLTNSVMHLGATYWTAPGITSHILLLMTLCESLGLVTPPHIWFLPRVLAVLLNILLVVRTCLSVVFFYTCSRTRKVLGRKSCQMSSTASVTLNTGFLCVWINPG